MQALFGLPVGRGATVSGFSLLDLLTAGSSVITGGVAPGVLIRVSLRCVLGFCLRTRGLLGLLPARVSVGHPLLPPSHPLRLEICLH